MCITCGWQPKALRRNSPFVSFVLHLLELPYPYSPFYQIHEWLAAIQESLNQAIQIEQLGLHHFLLSLKHSSKPSKEIIHAYPVCRMSSNL